MDLQIFKNNGWQIRTLEKNGSIWFVAKDVAEALGYARPENAISTHCKKQETLPLDSGSQVRNFKIIPESDFFRLTMKSQLETAEEFQDWVMEDVLPSIRKTGTYSIETKQATLPDVIEAQMIGIKYQQELLKISDSSVNELMHNVYESNGLPTSGLINYVSSTGVLVSGTELLKRIGSPMSMRKLNGILHDAEFLEQKERNSSKGKKKKFYVLTEKGLEYGENQVSKYNKNHVSQSYYENKFEELFNLVTN